MDLLANCDAGLGHLIAKNEDEYVQLAIQLAADVAALSTLRMSLQDLMFKSPVCDGPSFALGLESTYRKMWRRYCQGDVPSLRHMELVKQQAVPEDAHLINSDPTRITSLKESPPESIKTNGFSAVSPSIANHSREQNGSPSDHLARKASELS